MESKPERIAKEEAVKKEAEMNRSNIAAIKSGYVQWLYKGNKLAPIGATTHILPPGVYNTEWDSDMSMGIPISKNIDIDELLVLPTPILDRVLTDVRSFWKNRDKYAKYKSVYKRGILLYGIAGCGKSSVIMLLAKELISNYNGVVFIPQNEDQINWTMKILPHIKDIEPDKRIIVVLEDIDSFVGKDGSWSETLLLNFLDGVGSCDGIVTIATTNYPEKLVERITNRPSRFDRRYEVGKPNAETRRYYIEHKLQRADLSSINVNDLVDKTEGFTIDHLKEYLLSVFVLGYSHDEAFEEVSGILSTRVLKNTKEDPVGFIKPPKDSI
jgi:Cdc6-like AAA superfamily ATPase